MSKLTRSVDIIKRDERVISPSLTRSVPFVFAKGKGAYVFDADGRKFLDFNAGIGVNAVGHYNKAVVSAIKEQLKKGIHCAFSDFYAELPIKYAELLIKEANWLSKVFFSNSGTEAVEAGYKAVKWHKRKKWFIAFDNAFHGRTMASLSLTKSKEVQKQGFGPFLPVKHVPFPNAYKMDVSEKEAENISLAKLEETIKKLDGNIAGLYVEPIQGEGGYVIPPKNFLKKVQKTCKNNDIAFCLDEVQTGFYRTSTFLASQHFDVKADIISMAKAIGGGLPLGATMAVKEYMKWPKGAHANTFGANLLAIAAGIATMKEIKNKNLHINAMRQGHYLLKRLKEIMQKHEIIGDVRGLGLMCAIEIAKERKKRVYERDLLIWLMYKNGILLLPAGDASIRFSPPLIIKEEEIDICIDALEKSLSKMSTGKIHVPHLKHILAGQV